MTACTTTRRSGASVVLVTLAVAFAFGAIDQYLQVAIPWSHPGAREFAVQVSNGMSALWLLVPFLAGAWQGSQRRAVLVGLAATWLSVLAYVLMIVSPMEGAQLTPRTLAFSLASQWPWFAGGLTAGPLYGWLGHRWRTGRSLAAALLAALPILLEPAARWLVAGLGLANVPWLPFHWPTGGGAMAAEFAEFAIGMLLTLMAIKLVRRHRAALTA